MLSVVGAALRRRALLLRGGVMRVAIFTDHDMDAVHGLATTLRALLHDPPAGVEPRIYTHAVLAADDPQLLALESFGLAIPGCGAMPMYLPRLRHLRRALQRDGIELIHMTTPGPSGLAARYLAARLGLPLIGSVHSHHRDAVQLLSGSATLGRVAGDYVRWVYQGCDTVLVPSQATALHLAKAGWGLERVRVWRRGVDTEAFSPFRRSPGLRARWGVAANRPAILFAGRLSRERRLDLIETVGSLLYRLKVPHRFIVAGDGPGAAPLRRSCPDAVYLGGVRQREMGAIMASADVFLFPGEMEAAGTVVLEAQACGLPAVVSGTGGQSEHVRPDENGCVCRAGDAPTFAERIAELLTNHARRAAMSQAARASAVTRTWAASSAALLSAYSAALAAARLTDAHPAAVPESLQV